MSNFKPVEFIKDKLNPGSAQGQSSGMSGQGGSLAGNPSSQFAQSGMNPMQGMTGGTGISQPSTMGSVHSGQGGTTGSEPLGRLQDYLSGQERNLTGNPSSQFAQSGMDPMQRVSGSTGINQPSTMGNVQSGQGGILSSEPLGRMQENLSGMSSQGSNLTGYPSSQFAQTSKDPMQGMTGSTGISQSSPIGNVQSGQSGIMGSEPLNRMQENLSGMSGTGGMSGQGGSLAGNPISQFTQGSMDPMQRMSGGTGINQPSTIGSVQSGQSGIMGSEPLGRMQQDLSGMSGQGSNLAGHPSSQFVQSGRDPIQGMTGSTGISQPSTMGNLQSGQGGIMGSEQLGRAQQNLGGMSGGMSNQGFSDVSGQS